MSVYKYFHVISFRLFQLMCLNALFGYCEMYDVEFSHCQTYVGTIVWWVHMGGPVDSKVAFHHCHVTS